MLTPVKKVRGFTLIEVLIVIGIIAILAAIVIVAINPARQFAQANNTTRTANVTTILNAIGQDIADNKGVFGGVCSSVTLPTTLTPIGTGGAGFVDLTCLTPTYVTAIPADPTAGSTADTKYTVVVDTNGRVTVAAPSAQLSQAISVTR
jgi:prepilin-type N-terminal cleavage/methylation domain-containing protein